VFNYFCEVHTTLMTGQVIVIGPATHFQASTGTTMPMAGYEPTTAAPVSSPMTLPAARPLPLGTAGVGVRPRLR
jgi:hypothetical protein